MKLQELFKVTALAAVIGLVGCEASVDPGAGGGVDDTGTGQIVTETDSDGDGLSDSTGNPFFPNDGSVDGGGVAELVDDGTGTGGVTAVFIAGVDSDPAKRFICTRSARSPLATSSASANGLVGATLTDLLNGLGGDTATRLLNSVIEQELTLDGYLSTGSTVTLTADLLGLLDSIGQTIALPKAQPAGSYAVFPLTFPAGTLELTLLNTISVTTHLGEVEQETMSISESAVLDLLGMSLSGTSIALVGLKAHKPWDHATVSYAPGLLSVDVGEAMKVHELCTDGELVDPPVAPAP